MYPGYDDKRLKSRPQQQGYATIDRLNKRSVRLVVRTPGSHPGNGGSIPPQITIADF